MQDRAFYDGEGDRYHLRNRAKYAALSEHDPGLSLLTSHPVPVGRVLEVGCATGWRLEVIRQRYQPAYCTGIDPSEMAIGEGRRLYPEIQFCRGTTAYIDRFDHEFDLVIVTFVCHWIDRKTLLRSLSEIDRVLAPGGHLLLADFLPDEPCKVPYKHQAGLYTYKQNYPALFLSSGLYQVVACQTFNHDTGGAEPHQAIPGQQRAIVALLRKEEVYEHITN